MDFCSTSRHDFSYRTPRLGGPSSSASKLPAAVRASEKASRLGGGSKEDLQMLPEALSR